MAAGAVLLLLVLLAAYENSKTVTKCEINTSPTGPLLVTSIGTRTILSDYSGLIELNISEKIQFYCGTGFIFKRDGQADVDAFWNKDKQLSQMFGTGPFDYASLVQDDALGAHVAGYEVMMSIVWLHSLRTGNWRHWLAALRSASESGDQFDIRLGVSGMVEMPESGDRCDLAIDLADGSTLPLPAHIWAHVRALHPTGSPEDEFVLVGHNSPFFRDDPSAEQLCPSMCDQVSWLRNTLFARLHRYPINGLMLCCRVEDVAQKLDSFYGSRVRATATTEKIKELEE